MASTGDAARFARAVAECARTSGEALDGVNKFVDSIKQDKSREGISLLEVKNHDLLSYLAEMAYLMERMSCGASIKDNSAVERTVKYRTVLERIRPLEVKMKSQIEKLTQTTATGQPKALRARPELMELNDSDEKESDKEDDEKDEGNASDDEVKAKMPVGRKYVPPKIMAMHYDGDADSEKREKRMEKNKKRALQSTLIQELKQQYSEAPMEEVDDERRTAKMIREDKEKEAYEEEYHLRIRDTKDQKKARRKAENTNAIDQLLQFGDYMAADDELRDKVLGGKKRKGGPGKGGPKKRFKSASKGKKKKH